MKNLLNKKSVLQSVDYTIVVLQEDGKVIVKAAVITIIFKGNEGNIISTKTYKQGETIVIPSAPTKEGYTFIGWGDVEIDKAVANMTFIAQYEVTPKVTIIMNDTYTDGSSIALDATKTETVTGELSFTTDLDSDIAHIIDNVLIFDKHYEGRINILASALDKHGNEKSDSKVITVSCDVADTVKCVVSNVTADDVEADVTSATIKYDCNVTTTTHAGVSNTVVAHKEKTVTFEANESEEDVTRTGSFTCEHGETVEWSVIQHGKESTMPSDNQIWYKTNNGIVIVPQNMSPTTNEYTATKGVMTFADNVTSIPYAAFASKSTLTEFYGGMSLTSVGDDAFEKCTSLTNIDLPNCTKVGSLAFFGCTSLTSVNLPNCSIVGTNAFIDCSSLTNIDLPNCTSVSYRAFQYCFSLTSIALPNCLTIGGEAFYSCVCLTSISLPNCTTVYDKAFYSCRRLTSIDLPKCTLVSNNVFERCTSLTNIYLPNCSTVGGSAFASCSILASVNLPKCILVSNRAFSDCTSLTSINLPSCRTISAGAFYNCRKLTSIDLPNCIDVRDSAFCSCSSLTVITLGRKTMCTLSASNAFSSCSSLTSIYVTASLVNTYKANSVWSWFADKIVPLYTPVTYKSLSITADDATGRQTNTTIHCTWLTDGINPLTGEEVSDIEITEDVISEPFDRNTSETETVERTITYSNHGLTASCTITQGVWVNLECNIDLNSQWVDSTKSLSDYKVLMSNSNKGVDNGYASMKVEFTRIPDFKLYINSYAESSYDYTIAWDMDTPAPTSLPSNTTTGAKANTKSKQLDPTSISNFTEVSYPNDGGTHYVWITYRKDSSGASYDDRGYVAIPNEYFS